MNNYYYSAEETLKKLKQESALLVFEDKQTKNPKYIRYLRTFGSLKQGDQVEVLATLLNTLSITQQVFRIFYEIGDIHLIDKAIDTIGLEQAKSIVYLNGKKKTGFRTFMRQKFALMETSALHEIATTTKATVRAML